MRIVSLTKQPANDMHHPQNGATHHSASSDRVPSDVADGRYGAEFFCFLVLLCFLNIQSCAKHAVDMTIDKVLELQLLDVSDQPEQAF